MLHCPTDRSRLRRTKVGSGFVWTCDRCAGRAVMMPVLRRELTAPVVRDLWSRAYRSRTAGVPCPCCRAASTRIGMQVQRDRFDLDVCRRCHCVWFDDGEFERLPSQPPPAPPVDDIHPEARQRLAIAEVQRMAERARREDEEQPSLRLDRLPAMLGMPVELAASHGAFRPWLTWGTAALVAAISIAGFAWPQVVETLQMVPNRLGESAGLTTLTAFFVHAGVLHLLGNLWFLFVFGDDVEQMLGRGRWLVLVVGATFLGAVAQVAFDPHADIPCVGASGGISGLIVCYALLFPNARLGTWLWIWFRPVWVTFSARVGFVWWLATQALLLWKQLAGVGNVSALAHLGGVAAGLGVWFAARGRRQA